MLDETHSQKPGIDAIQKLQSERHGDLVKEFGIQKLSLPL